MPLHMAPYFGPRRRTTLTQQDIQASAWMKATGGIILSPRLQSFEYPVIPGTLADPMFCTSDFICTEHSLRHCVRCCVMLLFGTMIANKSVCRSWTGVSKHYNIEIRTSLPGTSVPVTSLWISCTKTNSHHHQSLKFWLCMQRNFPVSGASSFLRKTRRFEWCNFLHQGRLNGTTTAHLIFVAMILYSFVTWFIPFSQWSLPLPTQFYDSA